MTVSSVVQCTHQGMGQLGLNANPRVKVMGLPVVNITLPVPIAACPFMMPTPQSLGVPVPCPCIMGNWLPPSGTVRVKSMGIPLVVETSQGMVFTTTPPAPPVPFKVTQAAQIRVKAM